MNCMLQPQTQICIGRLVIGRHCGSEGNSVDTVIAKQADHFDMSNRDAEILAKERTQMPARRAFIGDLSEPPM